MKACKQPLRMCTHPRRIGATGRGPSLASMATLTAAEGSHLIDCYTTDHVFAGFCILQIGQIGQFDVFGYIADGSAYCLRNLAQHRLNLQ